MNSHSHIPCESQDDIASAVRICEQWEMPPTRYSTIGENKILKKFTDSMEPIRNEIEYQDCELNKDELWLPSPPPIELCTTSTGWSHSSSPPIKSPSIVGEPVYAAPSPILVSGTESGRNFAAPSFVTVPGNESGRGYVALSPIKSPGIESGRGYAALSPIKSPGIESGRGYAALSPIKSPGIESERGYATPLTITAPANGSGCGYATPSPITTGGTLSGRGPPPPLPLRTCAQRTMISPNSPVNKTQPHQIYYNLPSCVITNDIVTGAGTIQNMAELSTPLPSQEAQLVQCEAAVYKSSTAINSFTTEDRDLFPKSKGISSDSAPATTSVVSRQKKSNISSTQRASRRRSKSVGAPGFRLKFNLFNEKPRVPVNPKFTEQLVSGLGLPGVSSADAISSSSSNSQLDLEHQQDEEQDTSEKQPGSEDKVSHKQSDKVSHKMSEDKVSHKQSDKVSHKQSDIVSYNNSSSVECTTDDRDANKSLDSAATIVRNCKCSKQESDCRCGTQGSSDVTSSPMRQQRRMTRQEKREREKQICSREFDEFDYNDNRSASDSEGSDEVNDYADLDSFGLTRPLNEIIGSDADNTPESRRHLIRAYQLAMELLTTERAYVKRLHLIDQVFHFTVVLKNRELHNHMFSNDVIPQMFSNIKSIYQFHNDFLLPQLEKRMAEWKQHPRIGDVMRKFAPFLKLYTEYVSNFDNAMNTISQWMDKCPRFLKIVQDIEAMPECDQLAIHHHMLEPIQRVPRYELLLKGYLRHLAPNSTEEEETKKALQLVTMAATHTNTAMLKMEKFRKLLDINEGLGGAIDLVGPTREFIKEGKMMRISARDGTLMERILFLFTDMLLVCSSLPLKIGHRQQYKIKSRLDVQGMEILESHNLDMPNTFYVKGKQKSIEMHTSTCEEKKDWILTLTRAITELTMRQRSRRPHKAADTLTDDEFGRRAPTWVRDKETSMCMCCSATFTPIKRRHHCRACGIVICGKCSTRKVRLDYAADTRELRVCDPCFTKIEQMKRAASGEHVVDTSTKHPGEPHSRKAPVVLQVKASDPALMSSYLNMSTNGKTWVKRWFAVHSDFALYSFKANQDIVALTSLPLPGYQISLCNESDPTNNEKSFRVSKTGQNKFYMFQTESPALRDRWMKVLEAVVVAELPSTESLQPAQELK